MPYAYSNPERESDTYALPDVWITQMTAEEIAEGMEDAIWERRRRFPLAQMNSGERERLLASIVEEEGISGGWMYCYCVPGCMPDSEWMGPYSTYAEAVEAMREEVQD